MFKNRGPVALEVELQSSDFTFGSIGGDPSGSPKIILASGVEAGFRCGLLSSVLISQARIGGLGAFAVRYRHPRGDRWFEISYRIEIVPGSFEQGLPNSWEWI